MTTRSFPPARTDYECIYEYTGAVVRKRSDSIECKHTKQNWKRKTQGKCSFFRSTLLRVSSIEKPQGNTLRIQRWLLKNTCTPCRAHIFTQGFLNTDKRVTSVSLHPSSFNPTPAFTGGNALLSQTTQVCFTENTLTCGLIAIFTPCPHYDSGIIFLEFQQFPCNHLWWFCTVSMVKTKT